MDTKVLPILFAGLLGACTQQPANFRTHLTDSPLDDAGVQQVNVDIQEVSAHIGSAWQTLVDTPQTVDIMTLRNGVTTQLGVQNLPSGHYTQIRLTTGTDNHIVVNGTDMPLVIPSGTQTGLKIPYSFDVQPGGTYDLTLDFVASQSVVHTGNGQWLLKPVIHVADFTGDTADTGDTDGAEHSCDTADTGRHGDDCEAHDTGNEPNCRPGDTGWYPGCPGDDSGMHGGDDSGEHDSGWHGDDTGEHSGMHGGDDSGEHDSGMHGGDDSGD